MNNLENNGLILTQAQHGIWSGQQLNKNSSQYNAADAFEIKTNLNTVLFEEALSKVLYEATALHIHFKKTENGVLQFYKNKNQELYKKDFSFCNNPKEEVNKWMHNNLKTVVNLEKDPLYLHALLKLADNHYIWYYRIHHIACDGYAFALLSQRVSDVYNEFLYSSKGAGALKKPFGDYHKILEEDKAYINSTTFKTNKEFWINHLQGMLPPVSLSLSTEPVQDTSLRNTFKISTQEFDLLKIIAGKYTCNWSDILIALIYTLIYENTGANEIVIGMPVMGRMGSPSIRIPAMVMNIIPLRMNMISTKSISELSLKVSKLIKEIRPHQKYRYEQLRRDLKVVGGNKRLYGSVVNIMPFEQSIKFGKHKASINKLSAGPVEDISFGFVLLNDGSLHVEFDANPSRYHTSKLKQLHHQFTSMLKKVIDKGDYQVSINPQEFSWLEGDSLPFNQNSLNDYLQNIFSQNANTIALIDGDKRITFKTLFLKARKIASALSEKGIKSNNRVALFITRSEEAVVCNIALLLLGAAYVYIDPEGPAKRNELILQDVKPDLIIHNKNNNLYNYDCNYVEIADLEKLCNIILPLSIYEQNDTLPAYIIYTSGSTGTPKGIQINRKALFAFIVGAIKQYDIKRNDRILQFAPLHFDTSVEEIFISICSGSTLIIRNDDMINSIPEFLQACESLEISILDLPTAYWHELVYYCFSKNETIPSSIRTLIIGGEAALEERVKQWHQIVNGEINLLNTYGPSETTVVASCSNLKPGEILTIGTPLPGRQIAVTDSNGNILPREQDGELVILGEGLGDEYINLPQQTEEKFIKLYVPWQDKYLKAYRSGDLAKISLQNTIEYIGRIDNEVKISGLRINPHEIESVLLGLDIIREAFVFINKTSNNQRHLVACIAVTEDLDNNSLRNHLNENLPKAMIPSVIQQLKSLPKNQAGKIDRIKLQNQLKDLDQENDLQAVTNSEHLIIETWKDVLGLKHISPNDDFFMLGGQSLQTIQVANRLSMSFKQEININLLFQHPTVSDLASKLTKSISDTHQTDFNSLMPDCVISENVLPHLLSPTKPKIANTTTTNVLLTGATGFVGTQLLFELVQQKEIRVICLVRASNVIKAKNRIIESMKIQNLSIENHWNQIEILTGNLEEAQLGLSNEIFNKLSGRIHAILHNAAVISVVRDYKSLRHTNVLSVYELLKLIAGKNISFHHISTIAVGSDVLFENFTDWHKGLVDGYQQSKWAAEQLIKTAMDRGYPANMYRLGRVVGDFNSGYINRNDLVWNIIRASIRMGAYPLLDISEPWTPVNIVAKAIVNNIINSSDARKVYNLIPDHRIQLLQLFKWLVQYGYDLRPLSMEKWSIILGNSDNDEDLALFTFFKQQQKHKRFKPPLIHNNQSKKILLQNKYYMPEIKQEDFYHYLKYAIKIGLPDKTTKNKNPLINED